jgi:beta-N-acetylhexosaminidase
MGVDRRGHGNRASRRAHAAHGRAWPVVAVGVLVGALAATALAQGTPADPPPHAASPARPSAEARVTPSAEAPVVPSAGALVPAPAGSPTVAPDGAARRCVEATLARMPLAARAGQVLVVGLPAAHPADPAGVLGRHRVGGVFLRGRSSQRAAGLHRAVRVLQAEARAGGVPLHVAVDQEGGRVQTLGGVDFPPIPSAVEQGRLDAATLGRVSAGSARRLHAVGVTVNLAPVADTVPPDKVETNRPIGAYQRNYGVHPGRVGRDVGTVVAATRRSGVLATLKHFPGLGRVRANTDTSSTAVDPVASVTDPYLEPFRAGIAAGAAAVMISSAAYPRLDSANIAAFSSPIVTGLLRGRLGYRGLVVSDDLGQAVAVRAVPVGERAVRFVRAGGDMVLTVRSEDAAPMVAALVAAARAEPAFAQRLTAAARNVLLSKQEVGLLHCGAVPR